MKNKYSIVDKQLPIENIQNSPIPTENIIFNEEIKLNENNTRIRIIIQDLEDIYSIISYQYEKYAGLCTWTLGIYKNEIKNIDDLINKVFISQEFNDRGISIATGILSDAEQNEFTM